MRLPLLRRLMPIWSGILHKNGASRTLRISNVTIVKSFFASDEFFLYHALFSRLESLHDSMRLLASPPVILLSGAGGFFNP